jgi:hypothetical protein
VNLHSEIIDLASEGYFYPSGSALSSGKVNILPITAEYEELLGNANLIKRGLLDREFLNKIVAGGIDYDSLLECDKHSILLNVRIANYGMHTSVKTGCEKCDAEFDHDISFGFRSIPFNFSNYTRGVNEIEYLFERCEKKIKFRLGTCLDNDIYEKLGWLAFAKHITLEIDGVDNISDFYDYELSVSDSISFRNYYKNNTPGYVNDITITCPTCRIPRISKMDINANIFGIRPESKMTMHSEIFDLCYYSNGAFTQDGVYKMPTSLRSFYMKKLVDAKKAESDAQKSTNDGDTSNKIARPPTIKS